MKRILLCLIFSALLFVSTVSPAFASYDVIGADARFGTRSYGVHGWNYVMKSPTIYLQHVSSLYVHDWGFPYESFAEIGWVADIWHQIKSHGSL